MNASVPQPIGEGIATARGEGLRDGVRVEPLSEEDERELAHRLVSQAYARMSKAERMAFEIRRHSPRPELRECAFGMVNGALSRGIAGAPNRS